jgi:predicted transcriptional regulator
MKLTVREAFLLFEAAIQGDATLWDDPDIRALRRLERLGLLKYTANEYRLTPKGRKAVKRMREAA